MKKRKDGRWEGRIVVGHRTDGLPIYRSVFAKTQRELMPRLNQLKEYRNEVAVVLLDMVMPVMDGREFLEHKNADEDIVDIPVIVISSESDETLQVIADVPNVCKHIHLPVQSGSSRILKLMNRKYTREWYLERVAAIRRIIPDCGLSTDIFSGYHSETEEDHQESLSLMRECGYDSAFMFKYSERPGTYASKHLPDDISEEIKIRRLNEIIELQNQLSAESNAKDVGKVFEVMVEGVSKRSKEQLFGRTQQNKVVVFNRGNHHIGDFVMVKVTASSSATLIGEEVFE